MRASCPTCGTTYVIPDDRIGPKGRKVRCAKCETQWVATRELDPALADAFEAVGVDRPVRAPAPPPAEPPRPAAPVMAVRASAEEAEPAPIRVETPPGAGSFFASDDTWPGADADPFADAGSSAATGTDETGGEDAAAPTSAEAPAANEGGIGRKLTRLATKAAPDIESLARIRSIGAKATRKRRRVSDFIQISSRVRPFLGMAVLVLSLGVAAASILMRETLVARFPDLAGLYRTIGFDVNLRGLIFDKVETLREMDNGQPVLVVEGIVENVTTSYRAVPALRLALRGDDQQEIYAWSIEPRADRLAPGETVRFRSRLASPPEQAADLAIRFTDRRSKPAAPHAAPKQTADEAPHDAPHH